MWQRFTEDARRVILLAQEEAVRAHSPSVETQHLLLAWIHADKERAETLLQRLGCSVAGVTAFLSSHSEPLAGNADEPAEPKLSPKAKRALELVADEARRMRHDYIGFEHYPPAFLRDPDSLTHLALSQGGATLEDARALLRSGVRAPETEPASPERMAEERSIENDALVATVLECAIVWAIKSGQEIRFEHLLLAMLEQRPQLWAKDVGLEERMIKEARLRLLIGLDLYEEAADLRDELRALESERAEAAEHPALTSIEPSSDEIDRQILLDLLEHRRDWLSDVLGLTEKALQRAYLQLRAPPERRST